MELQIAAMFADFLPEIRHIIDLLEIDINSPDIDIDENGMHLSKSTPTNIDIDLHLVHRITDCARPVIYDRNIAELVSKILKHLVIIHAPELKSSSTENNISLVIKLIKIDDVTYWDVVIELDVDIQFLIEDINERKNIVITRNICIDLYGIHVHDSVSFLFNRLYTTFKVINFEDIESVSLLFLDDITLFILRNYIQNYKQYSAIINEYTILNNRDIYHFKLEDGSTIIVKLYYDLKCVCIYSATTTGTRYSLDQFVEFLYTIIEYKKIYKITDESFSAFFVKYPSTGGRTKKALQ